MEKDGSFKVELDIPFPSGRITEIVYHVLRVDAEPKRSGISKALKVNGNILNIKLSGESTTQLRVATNGIFESINLITQTIEFAGEPVGKKYNHFI